MTYEQLKTRLAAIRPADAAAMAQAHRRQAELAKPPGSLGQLETISVRLAGITGSVQNRMDKPRILVFAADNGVVAEGVSSAPQSVTLSQCLNMTRHKTGMSVLANCFACSLQVIDVGICSPGNHPGILDRKIRQGTGNICREPAMLPEETLQAVAVGMELVGQAAKDGVNAVGIGEMGIGNTTTSAAVLSALTNAEPEMVTGRGGGLTDQAFETKKQVIRRALELHRPDSADPLGVLCKVGGLDLAAMTGAFLGCAEMRIPAVVDGLISITAALCAVRLCPQVRDYLFLSHASYEIGYRLAARELEMEPCLLLGMRLGEGSGCPLMFQILKAACAVISDMATFSEAAIVDDYLEEIRRTDAFTVNLI